MQRTRREEENHKTTCTQPHNQTIRSMFIIIAASGQTESSIRTTMMKNISETCQQKKCIRLLLPAPLKSIHSTPPSMCKKFRLTKVVLSRMKLTLHATRRTPQGASRLVLAMCAWSVKTRRAPARHCRGARVSGHTTTAMHDNEYTPPSPPSPFVPAVF